MRANSEPSHDLILIRAVPGLLGVHVLLGQSVGEVDLPTGLGVAGVHDVEHWGVRSGLVHDRGRSPPHRSLETVRRRQVQPGVHPGPIQTGTVPSRPVTCAWKCPHSTTCTSEPSRAALNAAGFCSPAARCPVRGGIGRRSPGTEESRLASEQQGRTCSQMRESTGRYDGPGGAALSIEQPTDPLWGS